MAEHATDYTHGDMDIAEQSASFDLFVRFAKWGSLAVAVTVLWATLMFCTATGFVGSLVAAAVLLAAGVYLLREKAQPAH
ncbi:MAG TPA: aa3-type cytochrome c oxidase subunit IV [Caulobacteraceae bacterium]